MIAALRIVFLVAFASACASLFDQRTATEYYQAGELAFAQRDYSRAEEMFLRALEKARDQSMGLEMEAQVQMKLGKTQGELCEYDSAEQNFLAALALYSNLYGANSIYTFAPKLEIGQFSYDIGRYNKAVAYFEQAFAVGGEELKGANQKVYYEVLKDYGDALLKIGNPQKAREVFKEVAMHAHFLPQESSYVRYPRKCE